VLDHLEANDQLPVIWFIFSRKGCDEAAVALDRAGARFTDQTEATRIRAIADACTGSLSAADLSVLDASAFVGRLERGIASHHAGLIPAFKEAVERCFAEGLVRVVFATETLALGVNLPARSVVIDKLTKFTGDGHDVLTPAQFTQLTGRAGRRGIDERGHAIVPWSPFTRFDQVAGLAASRSFRLRSAFRPTYNMTVNLLQRHDPEATRALLARSFAQYQTDAAVVRLESRLARERARLAELEAQVSEQRAEAEGDDEPHDVTEAVTRLRPGDIVAGEDGDRYAVLGVSWRKGGRARIRVISEGGREARWDMTDLRVAPEPLARIDLPFPMAPERIDYRQDVASRLRRASSPLPRRAGRRSDDPRLARDRTRREIAQLEKRARRDETSIARRFDATCAVLQDRGHLDGHDVTAAGLTLAGIYHECDLLVAEALLHGVFDGLDPASLAAVVSCLTYEHRSPEPAPETHFPTPGGGRGWRTLERLADELGRAERRAGVSETRRPEPGFAPLAHSWAAGESLAVLLDGRADLTAGDFVRNSKQLIDLLRQLGSVAPLPDTRRAARAAAEASHRGVVALSGAVALS